MRGVAVYLPRTKTGRRQTVRIESPELAALVVAWRTASERAGARRLFPPAASLRASLHRAVQVFGAGGPSWDARLAIRLALFPPWRRVTGVSGRARHVGDHPSQPLGCGEFRLPLRAGRAPDVACGRAAALGCHDCVQARADRPRGARRSGSSRPPSGGGPLARQLRACSCGHGWLQVFRLRDFLNSAEPCVA